MMSAGVGETVEVDDEDSSGTVVFSEMLCVTEDTDAAGEAALVVHLDGRVEAEDLGDVVVVVRIMQVDARGSSAE
ncbi:hypothetical protein N665_0550s0007 [Sinapis alba]|nr:hypothetical protein N665_0550s0007 [Sinapis alba]